ncbi:MAG: histidine kinase [Flammeovirgaceae bacterium]
MRWYVFTLLMLLSQQTIAWQVDSLLQELTQVTGKKQVDILNDLLDVYACSDSNAFVKLQPQIHRALAEVSYPMGQSTYLSNLAYFSYCAGDAQNTALFFDSAARVAQEAALWEQSAKMRVNTANVYQMMGNYETAIQHQKQVIALDLVLKNKEIIGGAYLGVGIVYHQQGILDSALTYYLAAEKIAEALPNTTKILIRTKYNKSAFYYDYRPEQIKERDFTTLQALAQEINDVQGELDALEGLGYFHLLHKNPEAAIPAFEEGLQRNESVNNVGKEILYLKGLATAHQELKAYRVAIQFAQKAIQQTEKTQLLAYLPELYQIVANCYLNNQEYQAAIRHANQAIEAMEQLNKKEYLADMYQLLGQSYVALKNYKKAYEAQEAYLKLSHEKLDEAKSKQLTELQTKYETEKKEATINQLAKENEIKALQSKQNRNYFLGASLIALLILGIAVIAYNQLQLRRKADLIQEQLKSSQMKLGLENQFRESELKALKSQMNPHFIFNALNSIQEYIILNQKEQAANYLGKFADLIRSYLYYSNRGKITLKEELSALNLYLELEKSRFEEEFEFEITKHLVKEEEAIQLPTMLIQPYVENAIKHGLLHKKGEKRLKINLVEEDKTLRCEIIDNGIGRAKAQEIKSRQQHSHQSFAAQATKSRLDLLNYGMNQPIGVNYVDLMQDTEPVGTKVILTIPIFDN